MIKYSVHCDTCGNLIYTSTVSGAAARRVAVKAGTLIKRKHTDYCESCWAAYCERNKAREVGRIAHV